MSCKLRRINKLIGDVVTKGNVLFFVIVWIWLTAPLVMLRCSECGISLHVIRIPGICRTFKSIPRYRIVNGLMYIVLHTCLACSLPRQQFHAGLSRNVGKRFKLLDEGVVKRKRTTRQYHCFPAVGELKNIFYIICTIFICYVRYASRKSRTEICSKIFWVGIAYQ